MPIETDASTDIRRIKVNRQNSRELSVFALLLAIGVLGRWAQPDWNFTPLAAVTVIGGYYFRNLLPGLLLPVSILAVSDLMLASHDHWQVQLAVHVMMIVPFVMGRLARNAHGWHAALRWGLCGVVPATAFYIVTNFSVWAFTPLYEKTLTGLAACYVAALPFYRTMLAGDLTYLVLLGSCLMLARLSALKPALERQSN